MKRVSIDLGNPVTSSDMFRFVVLFNYGGIYIDGDVFLLRDFQPLYSHELAYRWSFSNHYNTAVVKLFKGSTTVFKIHIAAIQHSYHPYDLIKMLKQFNITLMRLPSAFVDPVWRTIDSMDQVIEK